jgi:hypothetical protein
VFLQFYFAPFEPFMLLKYHGSIFTHWLIELCRALGLDQDGHSTFVGAAVCGMLTAMWIVVQEADEHME